MSCDILEIIPSLKLTAKATESLLPKKGSFIFQPLIFGGAMFVSVDVCFSVFQEAFCSGSMFVFRSAFRFRSYTFQFAWMTYKWGLLTTYLLTGMILHVSNNHHTSIWMVATNLRISIRYLWKLDFYTIQIMVKFRLHGWLILMDKSWAKFPTIPKTWPVSGILKGIPKLNHTFGEFANPAGRGTPAQHGTCWCLCPFASWHFQVPALSFVSGFFRFL